MDTQCFKPQQKSESKERELPQVGNVISWNTLGGQSYRGKIVEMDSNVAHVICQDGKKRCVEL